MKSTVKKYCFSTIIISLMVMITFSVLTAVAKFNVEAAEIIAYILNYINICGPIATVIICTGIIVSKIENLNKEDKTGKSNN